MTRATKPKPRVAHPMDVALGARIRAVREAADTSQMVLARESSITFQQIQKYEGGKNRVSFSRLCEIAKALDTTVIDLIKPLFEKRT